VIWTGANDGPIHVTRNDGKTWSNVTPPDLPPGGRVQTVEPSPHRAGKAYVAVLLYQLNDWTPRIYRTIDYGQTWTRLTPGTNGIPADHPTRVVREDPDREGLLYAGTEFGMFISFDDGATWQPFQQNLPATPVTDLKVYRKDLLVSTMGRSFWILDDLTPLHQLTVQVAAEPAHLFAPRNAHRMRYQTGGFRGSDPADPEYPPVGAMIDYYLASEPSGSVKLEILSADGSLVRGFSSDAPGEMTVVPERPGMRQFRLEQVGTPRLDKTAGMHRFIWDLSYAGPWDANRARSGRNGPMVGPGMYQARLTVGNRVQAQSFWVEMDPRVVKDGVTEADVAEQVALLLQARDALSDARLAAQRIETAKQQYVGREGRRQQGILAQLTAIEGKLVTDQTEGVRYPTPMLIDQLSYLYGNLDRADQRPGRDAYERYEELNSLLTSYLSELQSVLSTDGADSGR